VPGHFFVSHGLGRSAPGVGRPLRFARARLRHLLCTGTSAALAAALPPHLRQQLDRAYPRGLVSDGALSGLWRVRGDRLTALTDAELNELFVAYVARAAPVAVTAFSAIAASDDTFVTLFPARRPTAREAVSTVPVAIVQLTAAGGSDPTDRPLTADHATPALLSEPASLTGASPRLCLLAASPDGLLQGWRCALQPRASVCSRRVVRPLRAAGGTATCTLPCCVLSSALPQPPWPASRLPASQPSRRVWWYAVDSTVNGAARLMMR
jgi:hypothetical protein